MRPIPSQYAIVVTLNQGERPSTGKALATFFGLAVTDERSTLPCRQPEWCQRLARPRPARHEVPLYVPMCLPTPRELLQQSHQRLHDGRGLRERETLHSSRRRFALVATRERPHEPAVHPESYLGSAGGCATLSRSRRHLRVDIRPALWPPCRSSRCPRPRSRC
jgi:hypothetical protein